MELISIVLENFRGYHLKHTILIDECLTGIIGKMMLVSPQYLKP